ncbi:hypothetical protein ACXET9_14905 [Brachybacterium sp. DNPG3]
MLGIAGGCVLLLVLVLVASLVLWRTVISPRLEGPTAGPETSSSETPSEDPSTTEPHGEYIPGEETEPVAGPAPTITEKPSRLCEFAEPTAEEPQVEGMVRGGGLEYEIQPGWSIAFDWGDHDAYVTGTASSSQEVENWWYSVSSLGWVEFPESEGGYPGAQEAARTILQCDITRTEVRELYADPLVVQDLHEEAVTIDGYDGWLISGTLELSEEQQEEFTVTDAWNLVVIVVDGPDGPGAFVGGAATGMDQQVADLDAMVASLSVVI